jgi:cephalosporin-C deacetylase-like acetyl esterase
MGAYSGHPAKRIRLLLLVLGMLIVDLRRAIDVLEVRPDVKTDQLAYFGVSYGAAMGGLSAEVEDRIKASVLAVGDGGLVSHFAGPDDTDGPLQALPARERERWLQAMRPKDMMVWLARHIHIDPTRSRCPP